MEFKLCVVLLLALLVFGTAYADISHIDELSDDLTVQMFEIALNEADILTDIFENEVFIEDHVGGYLSKADYEALIGNSYESPATAVFFLPKDTFDREAVSGGYPLPLSSVCFDFMFEVNDLYTDGSFAELSSRISVFGCEDIPDLENMAYVELVYSKDGPQIVVGFCKDDSGMVLTKASFIYNPSFIETFVDDGNATFPYVFCQTWDEYFDEYVYKIGIS